MRYIMKEDVRLETELMSRVRENESLGERLGVTKGKSKMHTGQEGQPSLEEYTHRGNGTRNLPEQFGDSASQPKRIPNTQAV